MASTEADLTQRQPPPQRSARLAQPHRPSQLTMRMPKKKLQRKSLTTTMALPKRKRMAQKMKKPLLRRKLLESLVLQPQQRRIREMSCLERMTSKRLMRSLLLMRPTSNPLFYCKNLSVEVVSQIKSDHIIYDWPPTCSTRYPRLVKRICICVRMDGWADGWLSMEATD